MTLLPTAVTIVTKDIHSFVVTCSENNVSLINKETLRKEALVLEPHSVGCRADEAEWAAAGTFSWRALSDPFWVNQRSQTFLIIISTVDIIVCVIFVLAILIVAARLGFGSIVNQEKPSQLI